MTRDEKFTRMIALLALGMAGGDRGGWRLLLAVPSSVWALIIWWELPPWLARSGR